VDEYQERIGAEYFSENWDSLLPEKAREIICEAAAKERAIMRPKARSALHRADECLDRGDCSGAYFHVRRAVEGYAGALFLRPLFNYLNDALGEQVPLFAKPLHAIFRDGFVKDFKALSIRVIADDDSTADTLIAAIDAFFAHQPYRNDTIHSLYEPGRSEVDALRSEAKAVLDLIDATVPRKTQQIRICDPTDPDHHWHSAMCFKSDLVPE